MQDNAPTPAEALLRLLLFSFFICLINSLKQVSIYFCVHLFYFTLHFYSRKAPPYDQQLICELVISSLLLLPSYSAAADARRCPVCQARTWLLRMGARPHKRSANRDVWSTIEKQKRLKEEKGERRAEGGHEMFNLHYFFGLKGAAVCAAPAS